MSCSYQALAGSRSDTGTQPGLTSGSSAEPLLPSDQMSDLDYNPPSNVFDDSPSETESMSGTVISSGTESTYPSDTPSQTDVETPASSIAEKPSITPRKPPSSKTGLLHALSDSCRRALRIRAQARGAAPLADVYDNINFMFRAAEQIIGRTDSQENGTCATAFALFNAPRESLRTVDLVNTFQRAPPLTFQDIRLSPDENSAFRARLIWTVMNVIVQHGGPHLATFKPRVAGEAPHSTHTISVHQTEIFPMPAMNIDESSTVGNAEVLDTMFREQGFDTQDPDFNAEVRIVFGDQLSMARVRSLTNTRTGHDDPSSSYVNVVFAPGFFHYQMAATHGVLEIHWGDPGLGAQDPGSLSFHNARLQRKPILLSSLPPYRTCRDLTFVSLYARVLVCLELVSGRSFKELAKELTYEQLKPYATLIVDKFTNAAEAQDAKEPQGNNSSGEAPDTVYANAVLFLRDALILRHFADAIKTGKSDHIITVLKLWALGFRAMKRTKYAHELLFLIHNIVHVWPPALR